MLVRLPLYNIPYHLPRLQPRAAGIQHHGPDTTTRRIVAETEVEGSAPVTWLNCWSQVLTGSILIHAMDPIRFYKTERGRQAIGAQHGTISKITPYARQLFSMARRLRSNGTFGD